MTKLFDIDPTPIAMLAMEKGAGVSAFADEDPAAIGDRHMRRLLRNGQIGEALASQVSSLVADIAREHPRKLTRRIGYRTSVVDMMKALRDMPDDLAERFQDGETADIDSRDLYSKMNGAGKQESVKAALSQSYKTDGKKILYTRLTIPHEAIGLPELIAEGYARTGEKALVERDKSFAYVHAFTFGVYQSPALTKVRTLLAADQPFTIGGRARMLSPYAWVILNSIGGWRLGENRVEAGNAARTQRSNTKGIRQLLRQWRPIMQHILYHSATPPYGFSDDPAITLPPSPEALAEVETYLREVSPRRWEGHEGFKSVIDRALASKRMRTSKEALPA